LFFKEELIMSAPKSDVTDKVVLYARFGLTEEEFNRLSLVHYQMNETRPQVRSGNELPFFDWEADLLQDFYEENWQNEALCALITAMMECVKKDFLRERAEKALLHVPYRRDTIGTFY
jgi:hypothetical protein